MVLGTLVGVRNGGCWRNIETAGPPASPDYSHHRCTGHADRVVHLARGGAIASLAVATALQAVDGVALKVMVDTWAAAPAAHKEAAFYAAFAVRQVEVGFASTASLLFGLTVTVYGVALLRVRLHPKWVAGLALVGGVPATMAGVVMAYTGFSGLAMAIHMPAYSLLLVWMLTLGVCMWRRGGILPEERTV